MWRNQLPNLLTLGRIAVLPVIVLLLTDEGRLAGALATGAFFVACLSDYFDGYLARKHGLTTTLGKFLDPLADKLLVAGVLIMLVGMDREPSVPAWIVVVLIGRELVVTGLRAIAAGEGFILPAEELGKYKTILQMISLHGLMLHYPYGWLDCHVFGMYFLWLATFVSLWSGGQYAVRVSRDLGAKLREGERGGGNG